MDKKTYIAPEMEVMNVEAIEMMAASLPINPDGSVNTSNPGIQHGAHRRDAWVDFWD